MLEAIAAGQAALDRGEWRAAAGLFEQALANGERAEALDGLQFAVEPHGSHNG